MKQVTIQAPATIANLVCGFDILGLSLQEPFDLLDMQLLDTPGVVIENHPDSVDTSLSTDPLQNTAGLALLSLMQQLEKPVGFHVRIRKGIRPGSGLGSSAASAAGAIAGAHALLNSGFNANELVGFAMQGEAAASGTAHADNVAPCLLGGVTLVRSTEPVDVIQLLYPRLYVTVIHPHIVVRTADARSILRRNITLQQAIRQWGNIAALVTGLQQRDLELIRRSLKDHIVEPTRSLLIPGFQSLKQAALDAGALGGGIAGAGPSVCMFSATREIAQQVSAAMSGAWDKMGIQYEVYVSPISDRGAHVI